MPIKHRYVNPVPDDPAEAALLKTLPSHWNQTHEGGTWLFGTGVPSSGSGEDGDYAFDDASGNVYLKTAGTWAVVGNIPIGGSGGANGANLNYFFTNSTSDISPYKYMVCPAPMNSEQTLSDLSPADAKNLMSFITEIDNPDQLIIPAGVWSVQINASRSGGTNDAQFRFDIYQRDSGGTETLLGSVITPILTGTNTTYTVSTTLAQQVFVASDRVVVKVIEVITGGGSDPTSMTIRFDGSTGSRFMMPSVCCCPEGGITELTGDVTAGPGSGSQVATLANSGVTPGTYVNATVTFDSKGRATSASNGVIGVGDLVYSDGFDGIVDLDGVNTYSTIMTFSGSTYTLLRTIYTTSFQIDNGITLNTAGYAVYCNGVMTIDGTVGSVGNTASASVAPVSSYGNSGTAATISTLSQQDSILIPNPVTGSFVVGSTNLGGGGGVGNTGAGGWGLPGQSVQIPTYFFGGMGGAGGRGTNGSGFTTGSKVTLGSSSKWLPFSHWNGGASNHIGYQSYLTLSSPGFRSIIGSPGGGGGAGTNVGSAWGGVGGAGGSSPFGVIIFAKTLTIGASGVIRSNGGNGAAGTAGVGANWTAGSGGGGAGGGIVFIRTTTLNYTPNNQIQALGGQGGASGGFGGGTASAISAEAGSNGADGYVHIQNINTGICAVYTGQY